MGKIENGGPAFPATEEHGCNSGCSGMDLRDYFAAKAMQGLLADPTLNAKPEEFAWRSYAMADAMLKARKGGAA